MSRDVPEISMSDSIPPDSDADCNDERDAYRAADQAYAAAVLGLPIKSANIRGIELDWPANRSISWDDDRSEVAMGLAGIAAADRHDWGTIDGETIFNYDTAAEQSRIDFDIANELASEIDPRNEYRVMADSWALATELVADDDVWDAIRWLAGIIEGGIELDGVAVSHIVQGEHGPHSGESHL